MRSPRLWTLLLLLLTGTSASLGQPVISVKPGLWEARSVDDDGTVSRTRECLTIEQLKQITQVHDSAHCKITVASATAKQTVADVACISGRGNLTSHIQREVVDDEHMRSSISTQSTLGGKPRSSTIKSEARFVGANCGNIKPGEPEEIE